MDVDVLAWRPVLMGHSAEVPPDRDPLLADLTPPQREAVLHTEGPLLVLAAAGSGKTRVITRRIAHLIRLGVPAWSILALTFTNKAAGEMRERVSALLGEGRHSRGLTVSTFHALCARLLRKYAEVAALPGLKPDFAIYDTSDQTALLKRVIADLSLSTSNWPPRSVLSAISNAKNELLTAEAFAARAGDFYSRSIARIYTAYERALRTAGAVDFDDLLVLTAMMLERSAEVREDCHRRWQYMLIDEYQDTNKAQFKIASLLIGSDATIPGEGVEGYGPNVCVVGDPDQAIYGWRGADISNILDFEENYPSSRVVTLGENFRSTAPILGAADALIRNNKRRRHKDLFTTRAGGEKPVVVMTRDEQHEAAIVADYLRRVRHESEEPLGWRDMAVFYRTNSLSRVIEDAFRGAGIPYTIARGTSFFEREEVRNALSYLRVVANPADDVSLRRVVNTPSRGIGDTSIDHVQQWASERGLPLLEAMRSAPDIAGLSSRARSSIGTFLEMIDHWTGSGTFMGARISSSLADLVERVIRESGLEAHYLALSKAGKSEADLERPENLAELVSSARQFEIEFDPDADPASFPGADAAREGRLAQVPPLLALLRAYLESVALVADADAVDPEQGSVTLMTLHAAKGLEFKAVAIIGLEEGLLPHSRAQTSDSELEEERRLFFVGITRAMRHLQVSSSRYRTIRGVPERTIMSRFLEELPREHVSFSEQADPFADADPFGDDFDAPPVRRNAGGGTYGMGLSQSGASGPAAGGSGLPIGCRVRHPQFGEGVVVTVTGGMGARATVRFSSVGTKTLVLQYARLSRID
ncbi:MAG: UvrD-helicase domain-containing protein [Phycisphaeraceae bacterium]|nr:UvrD-helicase domain-containing protein [Phycisphaeraceae bacterium]